MLENIISSVKMNCRGFINKSIKNIFEVETSNIKNKLGIELVFYYDSQYTDNIIRWILKYDKDFKHHIMNAASYNKNFTNGVTLNDIPFVIKLDERTFAFIRNVSDQISLNQSRKRLVLYIFGKHTYKYVKEIKNIINSEKNLSYYSVKMNSSGLDFYATCSSIMNRSLDTLYFDNDVIKTITNHIDKWINNKNIYKERNLIYKTGILLFGEPGCGKSSLITAIASHYGYSVINIDMSSTFADIDVDSLSQCINNDDQTYIICLEEIDCILSSTNRDNGDLNSVQGDILHKLLLFLDSNSSPSNAIFIATTNHPEKLNEIADSALLRKGRFDMTEKLTYLHNRNLAVKMCKSFGLDDATVNSILTKYDFNKGVCQSNLQNDILNNMTI